MGLSDQGLAILESVSLAYAGLSVGSQPQGVGPFCSLRCRETSCRRPSDPESGVAYVYSYTEAPHRSQLIYLPQEKC